MSERAAEARRSAAGIVLLTPASGQFLVTLDSSVMNALAPTASSPPRAIAAVR